MVEFSIHLDTVTFRPDEEVVIRCNLGTTEEQWNSNRYGRYRDDKWVFDFKEDGVALFEFKFVLTGNAKTAWMTGGNISLNPPRGDESPYEYSTRNPTKNGDIIKFDNSNNGAIVENSVFQRMFFEPVLDPLKEHDVIVIGSGIGGGIVAPTLANMGLNVLVLELGSLLFTTHVANLPRQRKLGQFEKHLWALFDEFKVKNYENAPGSNYQGGQAFNLGGRSAFWGGLIPRMEEWEMNGWPEAVKTDLLKPAGIYQSAEELLTSRPPPITSSTPYEDDILKRLSEKFPFVENTGRGYVHQIAPMAVRTLNPKFGTIPAGMFSSADLLTEARLTEDLTRPARSGLAINLNHAVTQIIPPSDGSSTFKVVAKDLLVKNMDDNDYKRREYRSKYVILAAGTLESTKIAKLSSKVKDPHQLVGKGITDHPILFTHFKVPKTSPYHSSDCSAKILSRFKAARDGGGNPKPYIVVLELGSDLNQGRYLDAETLRRHQGQLDGGMLCEIVFLFNCPLQDNNEVICDGNDSGVRPIVRMSAVRIATNLEAECEVYKDRILAELQGVALPGENLRLKRGDLGAVAHEVGTLRMSDGQNIGVVDENLQWKGCDGLFVCDLSVFPSSPAVDPSLTLAALSLRLANHIEELHQRPGGAGGAGGPGGAGPSGSSGD